MLGQLLQILGSVHVAFVFSKLVDQISRKFVKKRPKICRTLGGEDKISALSDDLLVRILSLVPTKDAISTMILSKRWQFVWTMVPVLKYKETNDSKIIISGVLGPLFDKIDQHERSIWRLLDGSLKLHKAPILETLHIELGPLCPVDADVEKWIIYANERKVRELGLKLMLSTEPMVMPKSLYRCDKLVSLALSYNILVDVPSPACLPSLKSLGLYYVVYKDEDSLVRLLSSCPILKNLGVTRQYQDNMRNFNIKVPSLECLFYHYARVGKRQEHAGGSLVIDAPGLKKIFISDWSLGSYTIVNAARLDKAVLDSVCYPDKTFVTSLSPLIYLELNLCLPAAAWFNTIKFSRLIECKIAIVQELDWLQPVMLLLQNSPNLKVLLIDRECLKLEENFLLSWNQPSCVPECLVAHLEIFEWKGYGGRSAEQEAVRYIFANSVCLKRAGISINSIIYRKKMIKELESMPRISTSSQLVFSTKLEYLSVENEMTD